MASADNGPWNDDALLAYFGQWDAANTAIAINAPLTSPACVRCTLSKCPGTQVCVEPATVWLRTRGQELQAQAVLADRSRIASMPSSTSFSEGVSLPTSARQQLPPYTQRCTEVELHFSRGLLPREHLAQSSWAIATRAAFLRRSLSNLGFTLNESLLEVSPRCTVHALFGGKRARGYKRDADPWHTRASIVEGMTDISFATTSRMSREDVLRNDNCFDALISAYTGFLWARESWSIDPGEAFQDDGWIWVPGE